MDWCVAVNGNSPFCLRHPGRKLSVCCAGDRAKLGEVERRGWLRTDLELVMASNNGLISKLERLKPSSQSVGSRATCVGAHYHICSSTGQTWHKLSMYRLPAMARYPGEYLFCPDCAKFVAFMGFQIEACLTAEVLHLLAPSRMAGLDATCVGDQFGICSRHGAPMHTLAMYRASAARSLPGERLFCPDCAGVLQDHGIVMEPFYAPAPTPSTRALAP